MTAIVFHQLNPAKTKDFIKRIIGIDSDCNFCDATIKILARDLSFAPGWARYDCEDYSDIPHYKRIFIANDNEVRPVIYTTDPVKTVFDNIMLSINETTINDYLHFYLMALNTGGENLQPIVSVDDMAWREDLSPIARKSLDSELSSYPVITKKTSGLEVDLAVIFRQSLMIVTCHVNKKGQVKFIDRSVIIEDLPIINDLTNM